MLLFIITIQKKKHHFCDTSQSFIDLLVEWSTQELRHAGRTDLDLFFSPVVGNPQMMRNVEDKKVYDHWH